MENGYLNQLLRCIVDLLEDDDYLVDLRDVEYGTKKGPVCNPLDLTSVGSKADRVQYTCIEDFWQDILWIEHNTKIHRSGEAKSVQKPKFGSKTLQIDNLNLMGYFNL